MSHGNARTTFQGRLLIVERHRAGWPQAHIAAAMGVSRKCVKTWLDRFAAEGQAGLRDRSSRPRSMPTRTDAEVERSHRAAPAERRGPDWIGRRARRAAADGVAGAGPPPAALAASATRSPVR